jgi:hypothetical protein
MGYGESKQEKHKLTDQPWRIMSIGLPEWPMRYGQRVLV